MISKEEVFLNSFNNKTFLGFALKLSEDILTTQNYNSSQIALMSDFIYLGIVTAQGSLHTSGTALEVSHFLKYLGYSENVAFYTGYAASIAISLALDHSAKGIIDLTVSTIGGIAGKRFAMWAYNKGKEYSSAILNSDFLQPNI